jgi:hypothetical protein
MVDVQLAVAVVSMGFLSAVMAVMSYLAFSGPSRVLTTTGTSEDASAAD